MRQIKQLDSLTSLRFVFALMVFFHHLIFTYPKSEKIKWLIDNIFLEGNIGVTFFFILSGFILAYNYQHKFKEKALPTRSFYYARFARIYPVHLITLLISIPISIYIITDFNIIKFFVKFFAQLTLTQSFVPLQSIYMSFNFPAWSISNEMFFYLVFPLAIGFVTGKHRKLASLLLVGLMLLIPIGISLTNESLHFSLFFINPFMRLVDFLIGIAIFNIYNSYGDKVLKKIGFKTAEFIAVSLFIAQLLLHDYIPQGYRYSCYYWLPMSLIIYTFAFEKGWFSKFFLNKGLVYLGHISFSFYLIHILVILYFVELNKTYQFIANEALAIGIMFSVSLALSALSFKYFEKPINSWLRTNEKLKSFRIFRKK